MTTYRVKHNRTNPYVRLNKKFLESNQLSAKAKGILAYLLSRPDDWKICLNQLMKVFADGEVSIRSGLKELKDAGYLVKAAIRDRQGRITGWRTDVYETPQQQKKQTDKNGNVQHFRAASEPVVDEPERVTPVGVHPDVGFQHLDNLALLNNEDQLNNELTNPPLTPPREEGERTEQNFSTEAEELDQPNFLVSFPTESGCLETEFNLDEEPLSAAPPENVKKHEKVTVRKYDAALGICPPEQRKTRQQRQFEWVPSGPWLVDGKLDPNFVDWQARDWLKAYGGDLHKKRADVLRHFKKDAANIAIAWEQYRSEQHHRYSNAALRMHNGMQIKAEEQQQLLTHSRAITEALPEEMSPVAIGQSGQWQGNAPQPMLPAKVVAFPSREVVASDAASASQNVRGQKSRTSPRQVNDTPTFSSSLTTVNSNQAQPIANDCSLTNASASVPTDSDGFVENPDAYKVWKPQPVEGEPVTPSQVREKLAALTQNLSMPKPKVAQPSESKNELEKLNQWLADPILSKEVMPRVIKCDHYTVEFNECGEAMRVMEV